MKRVVANLSPLLTCPAFMLWHLIGAAICIPALLYAGTSADPEVGGYVAIFVLPAWSAFVLTSLQKDLLHKPFGFVLPGHRDVLRRTVILVGVANLVAWPIAYFVMRRWLQDFAYRISPSVWIFLLAGMLTLFIALFTVSFQAVKAALADPIRSLRYE